MATADPDTTPTVERALRTLEAHARTVEQSTRETVRPGAVAPPRHATLSDEAVAAVREAVPTTPDAPSRLTYDRTLGEGGFGVVRLATQVSLGRKVAVKGLRDGALASEGTVRLLREAWITGGLEHPNVVPVHDLGVDAAGAPYIILKRIEGDEWASLAHEPEVLRSRYGADDALEWNLRTLLQVSNAVSFAHARGIVHRDLKPENVMVGSFGEVYLLDWGIAVSVRDDGTGRLPLAADATELAGTPAYMAPEMLGEVPSRISERTDVYLLGAMLYEVLAGRPPHEGGSLVEVLTRVAASVPELPEGTPAELGQVVLRAMHREPEGRYASAEEFRLAVQDFLKHRGSTRAAECARHCLGELTASLSQGSTEPDEHQRRLRLYGECRFGFRLALDGWAENPEAIEGLRRATLAMIDYELTRGAVEPAWALLAELRDPPAELATRVMAARDEERRRSERLERVERDMDLLTGRRSRVMAGAAIGFVWTVLPLLAHALQRATGRQPTFGTALAWIAVLAAGAGSVAFVGRRTLFATAINRAATLSILFTPVAQLALQVGLRLAGIDPGTALVFNLFLWMTIGGMMTLLADWRVWPTFVGYLLAFLAAAKWPEQRYRLVAAGNLVLALTAMHAWSTRSMTKAAKAQERG